MADAAGWQADPTGRHEHRYWDGSQWTDHVADGGVASTDAYAGVGAEDAPTEAMAVPEPEATEAEPVTEVLPTADAAPGPPSEPEPTRTDLPSAPADATATWAAAPPPPPPYVPAAPGGPAGPPPGGATGSKRGLLIGLGLLALVALAVGAFLLLGGDDDDDRAEVRAGLISVLNEDGSLTDAQAECIADHMIDEIGLDRLEDVDFTADEPPAELEDEFTDAAFGGLDDCDIDITELGGGSDDGATDDPVDEPIEEELDELEEELDDTLGDGGLDDFATDSGVEFDAEFEDMLTDIYAESFGIDEARARCLAEKIGEAMGSGTLTEEESMTEIFGFFEECDIDMSEISGG